MAHQVAHPPVRSLPSPLCSAFLLAAVTLGGLASPPAVLARQEVTPEQVDQLLEHSQARTILAGAGAQVWSAVAEVGVSLPPDDEARIMDAMAAEFTVPLLYRDLATVIREDVSAGEVAELLGWLGSGPNAEVRDITAGQDPPLSFDAFMDGLAAAPPPRSRLELVLRWTEAQGAADFYLLVGESARQAAHAVLEAGLATEVPYTPPSEGEILELRETLRAGATLSFLHRMEAVPDPLLAEAVVQWETPTARRFVDRYSLGVGVAIRRAGERVAARLEGRAEGDRSP